jgi:site-specific DNA recombinase
MKDQTTRRSLRGAIYTRVSTDQGLEQDFNSLDAQREASEAYIKSQAHEGWRLVRDRYDDAGFSGGSMDRPALQKLLIDVEARRIARSPTSPSWSRHSMPMASPSSR